MPKLRRMGKPNTNLCEYCQMMDGVVCVEGQEPPPYPNSVYGIPAHKKCLCQYIRLSCLLCEDGSFLLADNNTSLVLDLEMVPVIWVPPVPDKPDYVKPQKTKKKKNYIPPFPFGV